jgi:co-chaperonin GroES (HSP10)
MRLKAIKDKIVVQPIIRQLSSIIIASNNEVENDGVVVSAGPGRWLQNGRFEENPIKVGDRVRFGTMNKDRSEEYLKFMPYEENGIKYLLMSWQDVVGVVQGEENAIKEIN